MDFLSSIFVVSGLHLAVAMTPGPSTFAICCAASTGSRRDGLSAAAGVVTATGLWFGIALFGAGTVIAWSNQLFLLVTALANPFAIAFWLGTFLTALPATAPDHLYARIFGLIILQSLIWYSSLAILFSTAMRGRTFGTTRLLRGITAGAMIAAGLNALIPG